MHKITIDDLVNELDNALQLASECQKPSAMIAATMSKARLLGLDKGVTDDNEVQPINIIVRSVDARKYADTAIN
nr:hypothetical protein [Psychrobacter sp.]